MVNTVMLTNVLNDFPTTKGLFGGLQRYYVAFRAEHRERTMDVHAGQAVIASSVKLARCSKQGIMEEKCCGVRPLFGWTQSIAADSAAPPGRPGSRGGS